MSEVARPNMPRLTPYITVADAQASIDFYEQAFGFEVVNIGKDEAGNIQHVEMQYQKQIILMFAPQGAFGSEAVTPVNGGFEMPLSLYVYFNDVDACYKRAIEAGAFIVMEPHDAFWGDRFAAIKDPDGYVWGLGKHTPE